MQEISSSMTKILDGRKLADKIIDEISQRIKKAKLKLTLAVVLVGDNKISLRFIEQKRIACEKAGIGFELLRFPAGVPKEKLKKKIKEAVKKPSVSGIIIQLPLPKKFNAEEILNLIPENKDVDVLSEASLGKFYQGVLPILPPTVSGIFRLLKQYKIVIKGKNVVIVGAGRLVGLPLAIQFLKEKATVSIINRSTKNAASFVNKADILVSGVGRAKLVKGDMVKKGAVVIDAGSSLSNGIVVGDVDLESVSRKASYVTPVPGGVGPMTVACLIENLTQSLVKDLSYKSK